MIRFIQSLNILPRWLILLIDVAILSFSFLLAYFVRFDFEIEGFIRINLTTGFPLYLAAHIVPMLINQSYAGIIRHTGLQDGYRIAYTTTLGIIITLFINYIWLFFNGRSVIPLGVIIMSYLNTIIFLIGYRILVKYIFSYYSTAVLKKANAAIFGAGKSGQLTKQIIDSDPSSTIKVVAFFEDDVRTIGKIVNGVRIHSATSDFDRIIDQLHIKELIFSDENLSLQRKNQVVDACLKRHVKVRSIPTADKWVKGELSYNQIKGIKIEDLLGRESINLDNQTVRKELRGKTVFISGAAGSIGSELVRQVVKYDPNTLILFDQAESALFDIDLELRKSRRYATLKTFVGDVCNRTRLAGLFNEFKPDIVFHAAAYKHVPLMEENPTEAVLCNIMGTKTIADLSVTHNVERFVMISTDKAVNPTSVMGASKRIAEMYVQSLSTTSNHNTTFITTRFGNVLGSNGSVIPLFKKQIENRESLTVTHPEVTRYFMTIPEACQLVLEAGVMGKGGEIYIFDMGKSVKIVDLAKKMIMLSGLEFGKDIDIRYTGLRAGEKLYEELLSNKENTKPTHHPKILIAHDIVYDFSIISERVEELIQSAYGEDNDLELVELMKRTVPDYISNVSKYQTLDKGRETKAIQ